MKMNSYKILFLTVLMMGTLITLSSNNWLGMWMGLEINLMSFIPLISKSKNKKSSQAMMIYFLSQSIGSLTLLFSVLINPLAFMSISLINELTKMMIMIGIMIKVGAAPFHLWLPEMMANLNWYECLMLMTWQKIAPLTILSMIYPNSWFIYVSVMLSAGVGSIGGLNQTSLRKILGYSSINHLSWMMMFMSMNYSWYKYLIIYSMLIVMICVMLNKKNALYINQLNSSSTTSLENYTYVILFMSIGGLPPFLGFLPKWMVLQSMINSELYMLMTIILLFSLLTLFYYLRMITSFILSYSTINKWMYTPPMSNILLWLFLSINLSMPLFMVMGFI
uniref:NADH dehydrogenase subunit 2 n=1 Tax=Homoeocerus dilatatus TaxID=763216 RepID=UPI002A8148BE|nr:NADH dehydrogenase subunit 2 [Homoeocerus dilatatus]WOZ13991.1 NADH dehydrogenase subunit 2 [Homoeocerus dilatatus]